MTAPLLPSRRTALSLGGGALAAPATALAAGASSSPPAPWGAVPSPRQLAWARMEANAFVHFSVNTFTDREWGYGDESPGVFDPTDFSADQIVAAAKSAELRGLVLVAKHHDGFCLWPSAFTDHSVKNSPFRGGRGDVVREMSDACRRAGLKFGVYLSPWDRNSAAYGSAAYLTYYRNQLRELLTHYGPIFEVWFDGANGGDGYYGGAREARRIDGERYYDWPTVFALVRELQPGAVTFGAPGADLRWVGNEEGYAGDPCWATMDVRPYTQALGMSGVRGGPIWRPAEVDVSLRPGWFWHGREEGQGRPPSDLMKLYFASVGRGANLLLNLPPDRRGRIPDDDAANLRAWGADLRRMFGRDLAKGARAKASNVRGDAPRFAAARVLDGRGDTYWACDDGVLTPELTLETPGPVRFDVVRLREPLPLGLRVTRFALDAQDASGRWRPLATHEGIGAQRLVRLDAPILAHRVRLRVLEAAAAPAISEFALFLAPVILDPPKIGRDRQGRVSLSAAPGLHVAYTLDGSPPTRAGTPYAAPFLLAGGGTVRAIAFDPAGEDASTAALRRFGLAKGGWRIVSGSAPGAEALIDEDEATAWRAPLPPEGGGPCEVVVDLGGEVFLTAVTVKPAQIALGAASSTAAAPSAYALSVSRGPTFDGAPAAVGEFANIAVSLAAQTIALAPPRTARYLRLRLTRAVGDAPVIRLAEVGVETR